MREVVFFMEYLSNFSESLTELMQERNLTTDELGKAIGVNGSTVRHWKIGNNKLYLNNALKLADYFECSLEFLLNRSDKRLEYVPCRPCFYSRLKEIMKRKNITEYKMSVKDKLFSRSLFHTWKNGSDPTIETLIMLARYFDCTLDYLVGRDN